MLFRTENLLPLLRGEAIKAVEDDAPLRVPLVQARWLAEELAEQYGRRLMEIVAGTPFETIKAFLDAVENYGTNLRRRWH